MVSGSVHTLQQDQMTGEWNHLSFTNHIGTLKF